MRNTKKINYLRCDRKSSAWILCHPYPIITWKVSREIPPLYAISFLERSLPYSLKFFSSCITYRFAVSYHLKKLLFIAVLALSKQISSFDVTLVLFWGTQAVRAQQIFAETKIGSLRFWATLLSVFVLGLSRPGAQFVGEVQRGPPASDRQEQRGHDWRHKTSPPPPFHVQRRRRRILSRRWVQRSRQR